MSREQRFRVVVGESEHDVQVTVDADGRPRVSVDGVEHRVTRAPGGAYRVEAPGGAPKLVFVEPGSRPTAAAVDGVAVPLRLRTAQEAALAEALAAATGGGASGASIAAPMPGRVVKVLVDAGDEVAPDQPVAIVEAMKMENEIRAPRSGRVARVGVAAGDTVDAGTLLVELEPHPAPT